MRYDNTVGSVHIHLDTARMDGNLRRAQNKLDMQVLGDMLQYMPESQQKGMVQATQIVEPGLIETNTPYAHYQYIGLVRTDEAGRTFVGKYEKKPVLTQTPLHYSKPEATDYWFETAKRNHGKEWIDLVRREVGKG